MDRRALLMLSIWMEVRVFLNAFPGDSCGPRHLLQTVAYGAVVHAHLVWLPTLKSKCRDIRSDIYSGVKVIYWALWSKIPVCQGSSASYPFLLVLMVPLYIWVDLYTSLSLCFFFVDGAYWSVKKTSSTSSCLLELFCSFRPISTHNGIHSPGRARAGALLDCETLGAWGLLRHSNSHELDNARSSGAYGSAIYANFHKYIL